MKARITMADVARRAGVHVTTVSMALRNHPGLPLATRRRLTLLAEQMGYRRDPVMHALISYRQQLLPRKALPPFGYVTHWDTRWDWKAAPAHAQFFTGAKARADQLGYELEHFWLGEPGLTHQQMSDLLFARGIKALIIASQAPEFDAPLQFDWAKFSAIKIDYYPNEPELHNITNDQRAIIQLAMRRAIAAGYRRIGFVLPRWWDHFVNLAWSAGFLAEQQMLEPAERIPSLFFSSPLAPRSPTSPTRDYAVPAKAFARWFRQYQPEVLISYRPFVQSRIAEMGLAVPRDVAFIEIFHNEPPGRIAGVRQNCQRVGELAIELLAGQLQQNVCGVPEFPTTTLVEGTWVEGASLPPRDPGHHRPALPATTLRLRGTALPVTKGNDDPSLLQ